MDRGSFGEIDVDELADLLPSGIRLFDVRETDEYVSGHVPGAVHIALGEVASRLSEFGSPGTTVHLICKAGGRSANACEIIRTTGIDTVNIAGGTMAWIMSGRPVVEGVDPG
jgi:rhodanese-related sulfurtransferase